MRTDDRGFTLIELLIVVVIIGVLAAIAIPKFSNTKDRAAVSRMKSDLRNLAAAQEAYSSDNGTYYNGPVPATALVFDPSDGVTITIANASASGWAAQAAYPSVTTRTCDIFYGSASSMGAATDEGQVACTP